MLARTKTTQRAVLPLAVLAFLLGAGPSQALELGEITLSSGLNQPLSASIELLDVAGLDASQIQVALGTQEDFEQAGLARTALLAGIRFSVTVAGATGTIDLATTAAIDEPFLDFVVSAGWPNGRQLREYTVLLDLPTFSNAPAAQPEPATAAASATAPAGTTPQGSHAVAPGETLWEIAQGARPDPSISVQQMMLAIQRANPDAFIDNNINRMRSGRVLRIPSQQEISVIGQEAAVAQIAQQNAALGGQPLAVNGTGTGSAAPQQDELSVLSGDDQANAAGGSSDLAATIAALENELMLSEENLDRVRLENLELTNRLASLEEEIELLRNIIAIEDERIAQLQAELARQNAAAAQALADVQQNAAQAPAASSGFLQNTAVLLAGLLALVLAVLGVLVLKRRRAEAEADVHAWNPALAGTGGQDMGSEEAPGFLASLLARFQRPQQQDKTAETEYFEDFTEAMDDDAMPPSAAADGAARGAATAKGRDTGALLSEMGIADDMDSLNRMLDDIDEPEPPDAAVATETEAAGAAVVTAPEPPAAEDGTSVTPTAPESFEFRLQEPAAEPAVAADEPAEVEAFEFVPGAVSTAADGVGAAPDAAPETVSFTSRPATSAAVEPELENLTFDDTMLPDDDAEASPYQSRKGQDEFDTKLDLATAFEAMGDVDDALEILEEVIAEGNPAQVETAKRLQQSWRSA